jgi:hypothetical protein
VPPAPACFQGTEFLAFRPVSAGDRSPAAFRERMTLRLDQGDRRRLAFASALTVFALPAVWLANRDNAPNRPNVAAVGLAADNASGRDTGRAGGGPPASLDPMGAPDPLFLDDEPAAPAPEHVSVAVGTEDGAVATALATYSRSVANSDACPFNGVAAGTTVKVVNPDNGRSIECVTAPADGDELVLHPDLFLLLADLTTAPVPVEIHTV